MANTLHTLKAAKLEEINASSIPEITLACAIKRAGLALIETAGAISAYQSLGTPLTDFDLREAGDAAASAVLAIRDYHVARKP